MLKLTNKKTGSQIGVHAEDVLFIGVATGGGTEVALRQGVTFNVHEKFGQVWDLLHGNGESSPDPEPDPSSNLKITG